MRWSRVFTSFSYPCSGGFVVAPAAQGFREVLHLRDAVRLIVRVRRLYEPTEHASKDVKTGSSASVPS